MTNFNTPNEHGHNPKSIDSSDTHTKVNKILDFLHWSYFTKPHMKLLSKQVFSLCEAVYYLQYLKH